MKGINLNIDVPDDAGSFLLGDKKRAKKPGEIEIEKIYESPK